MPRLLLYFTVGRQSSNNSYTDSTAAAASDHNSTSLQIKPSVANTKFPKGVYPQRESNQSLGTVSRDDDHVHHDAIQPYRLKMGVITSSGTHLSSNAVHEDKSTAVVQLQPASDELDSINITKVQEAGRIPDELDWLLKKGVTGARMHTAATVIQK